MARIWLLRGAVRPGRGDRRFFRGGDVQHRSAADMGEAELTGCEQRVYSLFHARARYEVSEEGFEFGRLGGNYAIEIFREQRRERLLHRQAHALANRIRRPAVEDVPERAFAGLVIDAGDAQLRRQLTQRLVQRRERNAAAESFLQLLLRDGAVTIDQLKSIAGQRRIGRTRSLARRELRITLAPQR